MNDLRPVFEAAGCRNVATYIQSGNVIFDADDERTLQHTVEAVSAHIGAPAQLIFRTVSQLAAIVAARPFESYLADQRLKLYVVFLAEPPAKQVTLPVVSPEEVLELIAVVGTEAYVVSGRKPSGMYGFPNNFVEYQLGVAATSRNWNTVTKLLAFAQAVTESPLPEKEG
jgi:uncharacterized protein (DUF1697 family)